MNVDGSGVTVLSILGNEYSVKAPAGEDLTLMKAAAMLSASLADTKRKYPTLIGDRLLVLAALNLCSQQIELEQLHKVELKRYREKVDATVDVIAKTILRVECWAPQNECDCLRLRHWPSFSSSNSGCRFVGGGRG